MNRETGSEFKVLVKIDEINRATVEVSDQFFQPQSTCEELLTLSNVSLVDYTGITVVVNNWSF